MVKILYQSVVAVQIAMHKQGGKVKMGSTLKLSIEPGKCTFTIYPFVFYLNLHTCVI